ncbi:hypothetical protein PILCRDRAFT_811083 [Piloderma croceum F 1598]|uniref:Uncharacterized protein n=1 Tax=Piloderma croceum (strain F 1598) TaxID=765440 RepID=A0A0C3GJ20_PILCF|nr:hypothetical protein PILCRDRAFT_811083 [Piloderma croceum F 1598]
MTVRERVYTSRCCMQCIDAEGLCDASAKHVCPHTLMDLGSYLGFELGPWILHFVFVSVPVVVNFCAPHKQQARMPKSDLPRYTVFIVQ